MRSLRSEAVSLVLILSVPTVVGLMFPFDALRFTATDRSDETDAVLAFVNLSAKDRRQALQTARRAWREVDDLRSQRVALSVEALPDESYRPTMPVAVRPSGPELPAVECGLIPYRPSLGAPPPVRLPAAETPSVPSAFSREDLLTLK